MEDEKHVIKNVEKQDILVRKTWHKKWEINVKFGIFKIKEIRERLGSFSLKKIWGLSNKKLLNHWDLPIFD